MAATVGHGSHSDPFGIGTDPFPGLGIPREAVIAEFINDPKIRAEMEHLGGEVRDYWRSIAPVFDPKTSGRAELPEGRTVGEYRDSIHLEWVETSDSELPVLRCLTDDILAPWVEFGTEHMPEYACAAKTAAHFGGDGPVYHAGITSAQNQVREGVRDLAAARKGGSREDVSLAQKRLDQARIARSAAFKAQRQRASRKGRSARS
jgi:hypothetical protein